MYCVVEQSVNLPKTTGNTVTLQIYSILCLLVEDRGTGGTLGPRTVEEGDSRLLKCNDSQKGTPYYHRVLPFCRHPSLRRVVCPPGTLATPTTKRGPSPPPLLRYGSHRSGGVSSGVTSSLNTRPHRTHGKSQGGGLNVHDDSPSEPRVKTLPK